MRGKHDFTFKPFSFHNPLTPEAARQARLWEDVFPFQHFVPIRSIARGCLLRREGGPACQKQPELSHPSSHHPHSWAFGVLVFFCYRFSHEPAAHSPPVICAGPKHSANWNHKTTRESLDWQRWNSGGGGGGSGCSRNGSRLFGFIPWYIFHPRRASGLKRSANRAGNLL